jgi:iron complex transport system substrate-binding protein
LKIEKIEELLAAVEQMGAAAGCPARAHHLVNTIRTQMHTLQSGLDPTRTVKVLWVVQAEPLRVVGRDTFINEMIELAGGENAIGPTINRYPPISTEEILVCEADVIIQSAMGRSSINAQQEAAQRHWSKYGNLPAVKNNRIFVVGSDTVLRLGPRLGQGLRLVARYLHGAAFAGEHDANTAQ